jgi:hypothetical protein
MLKKVVVLFVIASSMLFAKSALCTVESNGRTMFHGYCDFLPERGGSFSLSAFNRNRPLYNGISLVSVYIVQRGVAEVSGLTSDGFNSRWGRAVRSRSDRACWVGSDFRICAR